MARKEDSWPFVDVGWLGWLTSWLAGWMAVMNYKKFHFRTGSLIIFNSAERRNGQRIVIISTLSSCHFGCAWLVAPTVSAALTRNLARKWIYNCSQHMVVTLNVSLYISPISQPNKIYSWWIYHNIKWKYFANNKLSRHSSKMASNNCHAFGIYI